jgi:3-hydroxybutyryl-CoA dehydrogenase
LGTEIRSVGVVGLGLMGSGIAQICAMAGLDVVAVEKEQGFLDKGLARIKGSLAKLVEKGKLSVATQELALAKLKSSTRLDDLAACDLVIEAIVEDLGAKNCTAEGPRGAVQAEHDLRLEHLVVPDRGDGRGFGPA